MATEFDRGFLVGILVGEGHFGGDGRQPHITLRMHTDHGRLFQWILETFPGGRLYGPYNHSGRKYYQWMARGEFLKTVLVPLLDERLKPELDEKAHRRYLQMKDRYGLGQNVASGSHLEPASDTPAIGDHPGMPGDPSG